MYTKTKGSILAYSLLVLAIMFAIIGSISAVSVMERKSAGTSESSAQAFQVADNAVQVALKKINAVVGTGKNITQTFGSCTITNGAATVKGNIESDKPYTLTFFGSDNTTPISDCNTLASTIESIKSVGDFKNTTRAVQVAASGSITEQDFTDNSGLKNSNNNIICGGNTSHGKEIASINKFCIDKGFKFGTLIDYSGNSASPCSEYVNGGWSAPFATTTLTIKTVKCVKY